MDYHAFDKLSYGLYIVSSEAGGKAAGCIVNTPVSYTHLDVYKRQDVFKIQALGGVVKAVTVFSLCPRAEKADVIIVVQRAFVHLSLIHI